MVCLQSILLHKTKFMGHLSPQWWHPLVLHCLGFHRSLLPTSPLLWWGTHLPLLPRAIILDALEQGHLTLSCHKCDHCLRHDHTIDRWKLHGKPPHPANVAQTTLLIPLIPLISLTVLQLPMRTFSSSVRLQFAPFSHRSPSGDFIPFSNAFFGHRHDCRSGNLSGQVTPPLARQLIYKGVLRFCLLLHPFLLRLRKNLRIGVHSLWPWPFMAYQQNILLFMSRFLVLPQCLWWLLPPLHYFKFHPRFIRRPLYALASKNNHSHTDKLI